MRVRWRWLVVFLITGLSAVLVVIRAYTYFDELLNRGLEEEKSYTRHAMEYHRTHPDKRQGDTVLEAWADPTTSPILFNSEDHPVSGQSGATSYLTCQMTSASVTVAPTA